LGAREATRLRHCWEFALARQRLSFPACLAFRASIGGLGVLPSLRFGAALPRDAGAAIQNTRLPRRGHKAQGDNSVMGELANTMKGMGRCEERALPCPTDAPGPWGSTAQRGPSGGVAAGNPYGRRGAAPRGERGPRGFFSRAGEAAALLPPAVSPPWRVRV
jgi:hypothetical protein